MHLPEFKTHLMLEGWTKEETEFSILWKKEGIVMQWDREPEHRIHHQLVFIDRNFSSPMGAKKSRNLSDQVSGAYTSFQQCIDDLE